MSHRATAWAYAQPVTPSGRKFVLVALADFADENHSCYPGQEKLAAMTGQTDRAVRGHLKALEDDGLIRRQARYVQNGARTSDRYTLAVAEESSTAQTLNGGIPEDSSGGIPENNVGATGKIFRGTISEPSEELHGRATRRRKPQSVIPADFAPTQEHTAQAKALGLDLQAELDKFKLHAEATGRRMVSWNAAFTMWLSKASDWQASSPAVLRAVRAANDRRPEGW